jgi:hypothetical protein
MSKVIQLDREELVAFIKATVDKMEYDLGSKLALNTELDDLSGKSIDCSGYARLLVYHCTDGETIMPDGSFNQNEWCKTQGFKRTEYKNASLSDDRLRIAFIRPPSHNRHVWLIINGMTIESFGGHGPGRRVWNSNVLKSNVDDCYVLTDPLNQPA